MAKFSIQFNGLTLDRDTAYTFQEINGLFDVDVRTDAEDLTGADGGNVFAQNLSMRRISFRGLIRTTSDSAFFTAVNALVNAFSIEDTSLPLTITMWDGTVKTINARITAMPQVVLDTSTTKNIAKYRISLICDDPYYSSTSLNTVNIQMMQEGGAAIPTTIPMSFLAPVDNSETVNNTGLSVYPSFVISGAVTNPTIRNDTTGQQWQIERTVLAGETITITKTTSSFTVLSSISGNVFSDFSGVYFALQNGNNVIKFSGETYEADALAVMTYYTKTLTLS